VGYKISRWKFWHYPEELSWFCKPILLVSGNQSFQNNFNFGSPDSGITDEIICTFEAGPWALITIANFTKIHPCILLEVTITVLEVTSRPRIAIQLIQRSGFSHTSDRRRCTSTPGKLIFTLSSG
jgi:hypothetical protein